MQAGDPVLVKDDYIADLWVEGPLQTYVQLEAGAVGTIDHFGDQGEVCVLFYDQYFVLVDVEDFEYDGPLLLNYTEKQRDLTLLESGRPLLRLIKGDKEQ